MTALVNPVQKRLALAQANHRRRERRELRETLQALGPRRARHHLAGLLIDPSPAVASLELAAVLNWLPFLGRNHPGGRAALVDGWFARLGVTWVDRRVGELSERQLRVLRRLLESTA